MPSACSPPTPGGCASAPAPNAACCSWTSAGPAAAAGAPATPAAAKHAPPPTGSAGSLPPKPADRYGCRTGLSANGKEFLDRSPGARFLPQAAELNDGRVVTFSSPLIEKLKRDGGTLP